MIKTIITIGDSHGILLEAALLKRAGLKVGDELSLELHGGTITLTPIRPKPTRQEVSRVIKSTMKSHARTMKRLA